MFKYLIQYVELKTKVASVFPYLFTVVVYLNLVGFDEFKLLIALIFLIAMVCLDMATTALNHQVGMQKETDISRFDQQLQGQMQSLKLTNIHNYLIIAFLSLIGISLGLSLVLMSSIGLLLLGAICVFVAITYSYGPLPIKNTCLGELYSGITMGYLIPLAFIMSQNPGIFIKYLDQQFIIINYVNIFKFILIFAIPCILIANIMLANNICDFEKDRNNQRFTLAVMIGQNQAIKLWQVLYFLVYCLIIILVLGQILPAITLLSLFTIKPVLLNIQKFKQNPVKHISFINAVKNIVIIMSALIISLIIKLLII